MRNTIRVEGRMGSCILKHAAFAGGGAFTCIPGATACKTFPMLNARLLLLVNPKVERANPIIAETLHISVIKRQMS